jgi:hypothetical protein
MSLRVRVSRCGGESAHHISTAVVAGHRVQARFQTMRGKDLTCASRSL